MRKLTKQTIKPVVKWVGGWGNDIHSFNTVGADHYHFTLDTYNGKNSFTGGFAWGFDGCYSYEKEPFDAYAINLKTGVVYDLETEKEVMQLRDKVNA